ncbi:hypothetical protein J8J42_04790 [Chryseobacterium sp. cx-311]|uniref:hypothetical protein n=1 Tax=Marnyiella aurantia TaxID=2758037 RepID=UPI001AE2D3D1|nr:hypothetical protein [Marnyiella aurantia]MBP0612363.1 hypothetical protein [Marnyiella aurantia]
MRQSDYLSKFIDIIILNRLKLWKSLKENYAFIIIILSLLGGLNQIINLLSISPAMLAYYSPTHGILDGVLFLVFISFSAIIFLVSSLWFVEVSKKESICYKNYLTIITGLFCCCFQFLFLFKGLGFVGFYWGFGLFISSSLINSGQAVTQETENKPVTSKSNLPSITDRHLAYYYSFFVISTYAVYCITMWHYTTIASDVNYNINLVQDKLNIRYNTEFKHIYNNGEYHFFKNMNTGEYVVMRSDIVTKDIIVEITR